MPSAFSARAFGIGSQRRTSIYRAARVKVRLFHDLPRHLRASGHTIPGCQLHNVRCNDVETLLRKPHASLLGEHVSHSHLGADAGDRCRCWLWEYRRRQDSMAAEPLSGEQWAGEE